MQKVLLILSVFVSFNSHAQAVVTVEQDAYQLAREINIQSPYLTVEQKKKITDQFKTIRDVLYGTGIALGDFVCASRDNDGRAPYTIALRSGVDVKRISGTVFETITQCQESVNAIRFLPTTAIACVSRDSDGKSPWQLGMLDQKATVKKITSSVSDTFLGCQEMLRKMTVNSTTNIALYCSSRDNDARAPFVATSFDLAKGKSKAGNETFETMAACWNFLGNPVYR